MSCLKRGLSAEYFDVIAAMSGHEALAAFERAEWDVVLLVHHRSSSSSSPRSTSCPIAGARARGWR
jgi:hypothetical protein